MYLQSLKLHNFRCFEDIEFEFHKKLTVIVGANGAGKTSILEGSAIAISSMFVKMDGLKAQSIVREQAHLKSYSIGSTKDVEEQYPVDVSAIAQTYTQRKKWKRSLNTPNGKTTIIDAKDIIDLGINLQNDIRKGNKNIILPIIAYYGTGRLWDYHREKQSNVFEKNNRLNGYVNCVDGTANIKLMMNWFMKMTIEKYQNQEVGLGAIPELEAVYSAMEECYRRITGCDNVKIQYSMATKELEIAYKDTNGYMMRIPINQLSDGYKSTISLVADIAYRMAVLNPQLLGNACKETDGIVLIDEVDLHLHPTWQQRILGDLQEIFPKVQFVVTTHSPAVINTVAQEHIRILNNGVINYAPIETYGKDASNVLKAIMGADERPAPVKNKFNAFYNAMAKQDYELAKVVLGELREILGENDPDLTACEINFDLEQI